MRVCLLVAVGHAGCWLVVVAAAAVGLTPRIVRVDILAKVLYFQELPKNSGLEKKWGAMQHVFLHRISMRV